MSYRSLITGLLILGIADISFASSGVIRGKVTDGSTGEPIGYATVKLTGKDIATSTDSAGFYVIPKLAPGSYNVEASFIEYTVDSREITMTDGDTATVNLSLQPDAFMLDQVVVTGNKSEMRRRVSSTLVNVVPSKIFELVSACSLADGLNFQPGVRVENDCQNCGFTQVRINGLDGHYSQILMNSRPVFSALTGVYGLEQIPANMIERVEVMLGGGSALFGSSAIGGTVNIITRDPIENSAEVSHTLTSMGISGALDNNTTLNASVVNSNQKAGLFIYGQNRYRDGYDHDDDGFTEIAQLKSQTIGARAFMRPTDLSRFTLEYHGTHEYRRGGDQLDKPAHEAMVAEQVDHNIHGVETSYDFWNNDQSQKFNIYAAMQNTKRNSYYGSEQDPNAYGRTHDLVVVGGGQWTHSMKRFLFMPAELIAGVEYNYNYLNDVTIGYDHDVTQRVNIYSGYLQNEWRTDLWGLLVGARIDKHSLVKNPIVSPRANLRFNPKPTLNFRLSYSTGFRSPQAYDEDFHVAVVGGERVVTVLAPGLKHESSQSVSGSVDWYPTIGNVQGNILFELFYTDLSDVFALRQLNEPDEFGNDVLERYNGSGAYVAGFNLEAKAALSSRFQAQIGLTGQRSRYKQPEVWSDNPEVPAVKRMFRTPDLYGYLTVNYTPVKRLNIALSATYTGEMLVQHLQGSGTEIDKAVETPSFFDANLKVSYEFKIFNDVCLDVNGGIMNIFNGYQNDFDKGYLRDSGYIYGPTLPRSLTLGLKLHI